jgi:hypothetical protein
MRRPKASEGPLTEEKLIAWSKQPYGVGFQDVRKLATDVPRRIPLTEILETEILQGRPLGRKHFPMLCAAISESTDGGLVLLDFHGVENVTGSWINEALVPLAGWMADRRNDLFPILMNLDKDWIDDLQLVSEWNHCCFLIGDGSEPPNSAVLAGLLDPGQRQTFDAVIASSGITGAELERQLADSKVKATAWNNRLKDLFQKRLLQREKRGREQVYRSVVAEVVFHG